MEIEPLRLACGRPTKITGANVDGATSVANADNFFVGFGGFA